MINSQAKRLAFEGGERSLLFTLRLTRYCLVPVLIQTVEGEQ